MIFDGPECGQGIALAETFQQAECIRVRDPVYAIPPAGQRFMAERGNARIEDVAASHASTVSRPEVVTRLILERGRGDEPQPAVRTVMAVLRRRARLKPCA